MVERAKVDREARGELYRNITQRFTVSYIAASVNSHDADEIVSEVFLAMVKNLHQFQDRGAPFRTWLYRLAITQVSRWARRNRRVAAQQLADMSKQEERNNEDLLAAHRKHLDRQKRDARRDVHLHEKPPTVLVDSHSIAGQLFGSLTSPSQSISKLKGRHSLKIDTAALGVRWYPRAYASSSTSTAANAWPSSMARLAPPPVLTCVT